MMTDLDQFADTINQRHEQLMEQLRLISHNLERIAIVLEQPLQCYTAIVENNIKRPT